MITCKGHCTPGSPRLEALGITSAVYVWGGATGVGKKGRKYCGACCVVYSGLDGVFCPCCGQRVRAKVRGAKAKAGRWKDKA